VVHVVADAHYAGADATPTRRQLHGRGLPDGVSLTSRLRVNAALHAIAEAPARRRGGRPKRIGARLGTPTDLARTASWQRYTVYRYRRQVPVDLAETCCLWYGTYRSRTVRVVLVRDAGSTAKAGYDLALITTDLHSRPPRSWPATPPVGRSRSPSKMPASTPASARPATAPHARSSEPSRSD
jgi:hypothetical protein